MSLHLSKYHIVGNHMSRLKYQIKTNEAILIGSSGSALFVVLFDIFEYPTYIKNTTHLISSLPGKDSRTLVESRGSAERFNMSY